MVRKNTSDATVRIFTIASLSKTGELPQRSLRTKRMKGLLRLALLFLCGFAGIHFVNGKS
jgi:hypothetical protein